MEGLLIKLIDPESSIVRVKTTRSREAKMWRKKRKERRLRKEIRKKYVKIGRE